MSDDPRILDVVAVVNAIPDASPSSQEAAKPLGKSMTMGLGVNEVMKAHLPRGKNVDLSSSLNSHYAFSRQVTDPSQDWDSSKAIRLCLRLSQLVRGNSASVRYAARVSLGSGSEERILPADFSGPGSARILTPADGPQRPWSRRPLARTERSVPSSGVNSP